VSDPRSAARRPQPWAAVPAEVGRLLEPGVSGLAAEVIAAVRAEVSDYDQPLEGEFRRLMTDGVTRALAQFVALLGHDDDLTDLATSEALGRAEHRAGRTLDALQSAYRVGARVTWRRVAETGRAHGVEPATMYLLAEAIFAYIDRLSAASVAGFSQAAALRAGTLQARRHALIELLGASGSAEPALVARLAEEAGLTPPPAQVAALASGECDPVSIARRLDMGSIGAAIEPVGIVLVADPDGPGRHAQIEAALRGRAVLGPTVSFAEARVSIEQAMLAWPLHAAGRLGGGALALAEDHPVELLLAGAPRLTARMVARRLRPLHDMSDGARDRAETTLRAWLDAHGDVTATAAALHVHPQTVRYRLAGLRELLGAEVLDEPRCRLELLLALQATAANGAGSDSASSPPPPPPPGSA
jgi:PucR C-terminal helix-turn-helix domain